MLGIVYIQGLDLWTHGLEIQIHISIIYSMHRGNLIIYLFKKYFTTLALSVINNTVFQGAVPTSNSNITSMKIYTKVDLNYKLLQIYNKFVFRTMTMRYSVNMH